MTSKIVYCQPNVTAKEAAERAITVLKDVEKLGGEHLYYCMQASNILALAGLRVLSPYNEFHPKFSDKKVKEIDEILQQHNCRILEQDDYGYRMKERDFSILNMKALESSSETYPILKESLLPPPTITWSLYRQWVVILWNYLASQMDAKDGALPRKWLQNWWSPHDISFGMMLGYPGIALEDGCERGIGNIDRSKDMDWVDVEINNNGIYDGADVSYVVHKNHLEDPQIVAHSKLWEDTLRLVYDEFTDEKLKTINGFSDEYARFSKFYREN